MERWVRRSEVCEIRCGIERWWDWSLEGGSRTWMGGIRVVGEGMGIVC